MLDIDTLNALDDLNADTLYELEVKYLNARLPRKEQAIYVERARKGDPKAREALLLNCLSYALIKANAVYRERRPCHIDPLDLTQEANLEMLEKFDKALETREPVTYLVTLAAYAIHRYCTYHAPMIQRPEYSMVELAKVDPYPVSVYSLDEQISGESKSLKVDIIEAPALRLEPDDEKRQQYRYQPLLEAVKRLSPFQRATIIRQYGLFGQPAETPTEIAESSHIKPTAVINCGYGARRNLARALEGVLYQMLCPKPTPED